MKSELTGEILAEMRNMKNYMPEELAKSLRKEWNLDIVGIAKFLCELGKLPSTDCDS